MPSSASQDRSNANKSAYDVSFWLTYVSNTGLMVSVSMMFRYADFVSVLSQGSDDTEHLLGWIVGIGATGSIAMRMIQGVAIDRLGAGRVWVCSLIAAALTFWSHQFIQQVDTPPIFLIRILFATSVAGAFGASITFVSLRAPEGRIAELIGVLGSSGFIGMAGGPYVADWILRPGQVDLPHIHLLFKTAAAIVVFSAVSAFAANVKASPARKRSSLGNRPPAWWLLKRYHPGSILLMGLAMGIGIGIPFNFVRPFSESLDVSGIGPFFLVYAGTAFVVRIFTRTLPDRWGVRPTVTMGMCFLAISMFAYLIAFNRWLLLVPAIFGGIAHAFVFPAAVAGCSVSFPVRYRGLATTLMLGMFDLGNLVGPPTVGTILKLTRDLGLPDYEITFALAGATLLALTAIFVATSRKGPPKVRSATVRGAA